MARRNSERWVKPETKLDWGELLGTALTAPGSLGNSYNRFYNYSFLNQVFLLQQGCPIEPIATYNRWQEMGRQVKRGSKALAIVRPITVKTGEQEEAGEPKRITRFKPVRCIFPVSATEGEELPEPEIQDWSAERALSVLAIRQVAFRDLDGNTAGYSIGRDIAINPVAPYPTKTLMHELGHVVLGHTAQEQVAEYQSHRGTKEFQAEGTAFLAMNELEVPESQWNPAESRAYIQTWIGKQVPTEKDIRQVFTATDTIIKAGREQPASVDE